MPDAVQVLRVPYVVTNIRDDKARSKFWRTSFEQRRCLVPASSYCEPKGEKPATWHWFSVNGDDARSVFAFPGVWTRYRGPIKISTDASKGVGRRSPIFFAASCVAAAVH